MDKKRDETDGLPSTTRRASLESMMSGTSMGSKGRTRPQMDRSLAFETEKPNGPWRDKVTVDVLKIGEDDFKGTIKLREARDKIYKEAMGLPRGNLHAVEFEFRGDHSRKNSRSQTRKRNLCEGRHEKSQDQGLQVVN